MPKVSEMLPVIDLTVEASTPITAVSKRDLESDAERWAVKGAALRIIDRDSYIDASHFLRSIKSVRADIQRWFEPHIEAAMETKRKAEAARKALADERDRMEAPLVEAEGKVKRALLTWESEQERVRQEQERALQAEAQARAEAATLDAAAALEREAVATGNADMLKEAEDILSQPIEAPVVAVKKLMPKMQGITYRDQWKAHDDIDIKALARAVADGVVASTLILPNVSALNALARATQGTQPVPGVKFYNDRIVAARG